MNVVIWGLGSIVAIVLFILARNWWSTREIE